MNKHLIILLIILIILPAKMKAQDTAWEKDRMVTYQTQFFQIKEAANYGIVFNGLNLVVGYEYSKKNKSHILKYIADLGFGPDFGKGVGLNWHFKPGDLYYGWNISGNDSYSLFLGPYTSVNYQWQLYPELQSGHMFWFTFIDFGPRLYSEFKLKSKRIRITFSSAVAGLVSRPVPATESHFYSLSFSDFVTNPHKDLKFGSLDLIEHIDLGITLVNFNKKKMSAGYGFQYFGYNDDPRLDYLTHSVNLYWTLGKKEN